MTVYVVPYAKEDVAGVVVRREYGGRGITMGLSAEEVRDLVQGCVQHSDEAREALRDVGWSP